MPKIEVGDLVAYVRHGMITVGEVTEIDDHLLRINKTTLRMPEEVKLAEAMVDGRIIIEI